MTLLGTLLAVLLAFPTARADQNPPGCTGSGLGILLFTDASDVHVGNTLHYSVTVFNGTGTGPVVCDATGITAFLTTPDGVSHPIALTQTNLVNGQSDYYPNVVSYTVRAQDIQPDGTVRAEAIDSGTIHQNVQDSTGGGHQQVNTIVSSPCINVTAQCTAGVGETGLITYSGTVTNCGNDVLMGLTMTNFYNGGAYPIAITNTLAVGQSAAFSGSYLPASPCTPSTATFIVQASDSTTTYPTTVTATTSTTCSEVLTPGIVVTKSCPPVPSVPGQLLNYSGSVSNAGNVTLNNVVVVDNLPAVNTTVFTIATLAPGQVANFNGSYLTPTNCSVTDTVTGTATTACGAQVSNSSTTTCPILTTPQILVAATCPGTPVVPGGTVTYAGTVQNTGNITLTNVAVVSDLPVGNTRVFTVAQLAPNATTNFTASYVVPANNCSITAVFTATGSGICSLGSAVTNSTTTTCGVITSPAIAVSLACPATTANAGGLITYSGTVHNTGNVILNNVYVVNSQPAPNTAVIGPITLAVGASTNFTTSFIAPADSCSVSSTVLATGNDNCSGAPVSNSATASCPLNTSPQITISQSCPVVPAVPGGLLTYSGSVSNAGNVTLTNISVLNNLSGSTPVFTVAVLAPGVAVPFTGSYLAPTNCSSTSTSTVTARSTCGVLVSSSTTSTCPVLTAPAISVTENCPVNPTAPGALLTYSGSVTNVGNITLTNLVVVNSVSGSTPVFVAATLVPGEGTNFTGSYLTPTNCSSTSVLTASAASACGGDVTNTASATCPIITTPVLSLTQTCPAGPVAPGALLTFSGTITNTGNITITNVVVVNSMSGGQIFTVASLAPGTGASYTGSYLAPASCSVTSVSTATGESSCGLAVNASVTSTCAITTTPQISINQSCPLIPAIPGGLLVYSGSVSNSGNITLTNVVVMNNQSGSTPLLMLPTLIPGQTAAFTGSYLAPTNCSSTSISTVNARSICGVAVNSSTTSTCPVLTTPSLSITENCPVNPTAPGALLTYSGTVTNTGNITLTNVVVVNSLSGSTVIYQAASLAPGVGAKFTGSYLTPTNCSTTSILTASAASACGGEITNTASATCPIITTPVLSLTQTCPTGAVGPGALLTYSGTVTNTGNITITNVVVINNLSGGQIFAVASLAPGTGAAYTGSYLAPASCSAVSVSTATGVSSCGLAVNATVTSTCAITTTPQISITESCPVVPAVPGGLLTYSGTVINNGNITLTNVVVLNNLNGLTPVLTLATLAPAQVVPYTGSYLAPTNCASTSTASVTARSICGVSVSSSASSTCPILTTPAIIVTQNCPSTPVPPGGILTYSGSVSNAGNIILTNIIVTSDRPADNTVVATIAALAPGATTNFAGSYQVPLDCCVVFSTVTASGENCAGMIVSNAFTRTCTVATQPGLVVSKTCTSGLLRPGDLLTYSGSVSNSGNITLVNVSLTDAEAPGNSPLSGAIDLAPGQSVSFNGSFTVPPDFCGPDTLTANAQDVCTYLPVVASTSTTCPIITAPAISVTMNCPAAPTPRGGLFTYSGTVSNPGNVSLINVYVVDDEPTNNTPVIGPISLAPGQSVEFTNSYVAPTCCCLIIDTLTARGSDRCNGTNVSDTSTAVCPLQTIPSLGVVEFCPPGPIPMGSTFAFTGFVTNSGEVVLTNVVVFGPLGTNTPVLGPLTLAPGQAVNYSGTFTAVFNTAAITVTASGQETCGGTSGSDSASCTVVPTPQIVKDPGTNVISFPTALGKTYTVQYKKTLADTNWISLPPVSGTGTNLFYKDAISGPTRFYRVMVQP